MKMIKKPPVRRLFYHAKMAVRPPKAAYGHKNFSQGAHLRQISCLFHLEYHRGIFLRCMEFLYGKELAEIHK